MTDVFISYAREDRPVAQEIAQLLGKEGYSVWWDRELGAGDEFSEVIERSLDAANAVIVLWSEGSRKSHWVRDEAAVGRDRNRLIPIALDAAQPPLGFRQIHTITATDVRNDPRIRAALMGSLATLCGRGGAASPSTPAPVAKPIQQILQEEKRQRTFMRSYWLTGLPIALAFAVGVALLGQAAETFPFRSLIGDGILGFVLASLSLGLGRLFIVAGRRLAKRKSVRYFDGPTLIALRTAGAIGLLVGFAAMLARGNGMWDTVLAAVFIAIILFPVIALCSVPIGLLKGAARTTFEDGR